MIATGNYSRLKLGRQPVRWIDNVQEIEEDLVIHVALTDSRMRPKATTA